MVLSLLAPSPSSQPFEVMDQGLPCNIGFFNAGWYDIAMGLTALARLARTAKRYQKAVLPHLYTNVLAPARTELALFQKDMGDACLQKLSARFGPSPTKWPMFHFFAGQAAATCRISVLAMKKAVRSSGASAWTCTTRLDLRGKIRIDLLPIMQAAPHLRELAISIYQPIDAAAFGKTLAGLKKLRGLCIQLNPKRAHARHFEVLRALTKCELALDWLSLECRGCDGHNHPYYDQCAPDLPFEERAGPSVKALRISCTCKRTIRYLCRILRKGGTEILQTPLAPGVAGSVLEITSLRDHIKQVRVLEIALDKPADVSLSAEDFPALTSLILTYVRRPSNEPVAKPFYAALQAMSKNIKTLRLPHLHPYMFYPLIGFLLARKPSRMDGIERLEIGTESMQYTANHWRYHYQARIPSLLESLKVACLEAGVKLIFEEPAWGRTMPWEDWMRCPMRLDCGTWLRLGANGESLLNVDRGSLQKDMYETWTMLDKEQRIHDEYFEELEQALEDHLTAAEWQEEREQRYAIKAKYALPLDPGQRAGYNSDSDSDSEDSEWGNDESHSQVEDNSSDTSPASDSDSDSSSSISLDDSTSATAVELEAAPAYKTK